MGSLDCRSARRFTSTPPRVQLICKSKPRHFLELPDPLLDGRTRHPGRARQPKTLTTKGCHYAAINHAPLEVRLNRAFAARQITDETADKRVTRASRVNHPAQWKGRRHGQAAGRGKD